MKFKSIPGLKIHSYFCAFRSFNAIHSSCAAFVYAETHIKLVINVFLSVRTDCDDRRQSVHLFSVKGREQGRLDVTLLIVQ